jgi:hypothetical protein
MAAVDDSKPENPLDGGHSFQSGFWEAPEALVSAGKFQPTEQRIGVHLMNSFTKKIGTAGAIGVAASALVVGGIVAPANAAQNDEPSNSQDSYSFDSTSTTLNDLLNGILGGNTASGIVGNDTGLIDGGLINGPIVETGDIGSGNEASDIGSGNEAGNGNEVGSGNETGSGNDVQAPIGSGNDVPVGSGNDVDAPVDVPIEAPVDAPVGSGNDTSVDAPVDAPVGNGTNTDLGTSVSNSVDALLNDTLGGLGLGR